MAEIEKLVEECARDKFERGIGRLADHKWENLPRDLQDFERAEARTIIRRTLEFAAGRAKTAWLTTDCGTIGDAEYGEALCNEISEALRSLAKPKG